MIAKPRPPIEFDCPQCGRRFKRYASQVRLRGPGKFCSYRCRDAAGVRRRTTTCKRCGVEYVRANQHVGRSDAGKFCSLGCYRAWRSDQPRKIVTKVCPVCGVEFSRPRAWGKAVTCSRPCQAKHRVRAGSTPRRGSGWAKIAEAIRVRDGRLCVRCGAPELPRRKHAVDHIVPWVLVKSDEAKANADANLATLCHECHGVKTTVIEPRLLKGDWLALREFYGVERADAALRNAPDPDPDAAHILGLVQRRGEQPPRRPTP